MNVGLYINVQIIPKFWSKNCYDMTTHKCAIMIIVAACTIIINCASCYLLLQFNCKIVMIWLLTENGVLFNGVIFFPVIIWAPCVFHFQWVRGTQTNFAQTLVGLLGVRGRRDRTSWI